MISIIVTCYNIEKYIAICLNSLKVQTIDNFEVLIIDDGSTDNSQSVIKETIKDDTRFQYIRKKNGGVSSARNLGLEKARGEYICFIDGDDYVESDYLEKLYTPLDGTYDFSICNIKRIYENYTSFNKIDEQTVRECRYPALWNKMCKKELFDKYKIRFVENIWYEDLAAGSEIYLVSKKFFVTDAYIYNYIQHATSLVKTYDDRIFDIYKTVEHIEQFAELNNVKDDNIQTLEFINIYHILVGTTYRASFHNQFNIKMLKAIYNYVYKKYPKWNKNAYLKNLSITFKIYLLLLFLHQFWMVYLLLKIFNNKIHL